MSEPCTLSVQHAAELLRRGRLQAEELVESCLAHIGQRDKSVCAWAYVDADGALEQARRLDRHAREQRWHGPLHGIPVGIKDVFDVRGMPTRAGSPAYPPRQAEADAAVVGRLREAGAVVMGKTNTTPFAFMDPAETRNPWNPEHTPGGSSAGSAVAVADRMVPGALGSQTGGSTVRPAAYNGIVGFKPGLGGIDTTGMLPLSPTMDHVGLFARSVTDIDWLWQVLRHERTVSWQATREKLLPGLLPQSPGRLLWLRGAVEEEADPACVANAERVCALLRERGVHVVEREASLTMARAQQVYRTILAAEVASVHQQAYTDRRDTYPPLLARTVEEGLTLHAVDYIAALQERRTVRDELRALMDGADAVITPATPTPPGDVSHTGSAAYNVPWSLAGLPAVGLPTAIGDDGLPVGIQLASSNGAEDTLLSMAGWCESVIGFDATPP